MFQQKQEHFATLYLVGGLEHEFYCMIFHIVGNVIIPTDELHFSEGLVETTNQILTYLVQ